MSPSLRTAESRGRSSSTPLWGAGLAQRRLELGLLFGSHLLDEERENRLSVTARAERRPHQIGRAFFTGHRGPVSIRLAFSFSPHPAFAVQVVHRGKHGRVGDLTLVGQLFEDLANGHPVLPVPNTFHDCPLEVTESSLLHRHLPPFQML